MQFGFNGMHFLLLLTACAQRTEEKANKFISREERSEKRREKKAEKKHVGWATIKNYLCAMSHHLNCLMFSGRSIEWWRVLLACKDRHTNTLTLNGTRTGIGLFRLMTCEEFLRVFGWGKFMSDVNK